MSKWIIAVLAISLCLMSRVSHAGDNVVKYGSFNHRPIELRLDGQVRRVSLCVAKVSVYEVPVHLRQQSDWSTPGQELGFLIAEVQRRVALRRPTKIDTTKPNLFDNDLYFRGGLPIWGPYEAVASIENDYKCLMFAHHARFRHGVIYAKGPTNPVGYYGYSDTRMVHGGVL